MLEVFRVVIPEFQGITPVASDRVKYKPTGEKMIVKVRSFEVSDIQFWETEFPGVFETDFVWIYEADLLEKKFLEAGLKFDRIP